MRQTILLIIISIFLYSCNGEEYDSKGSKLSGKSFFGNRYGEWKSYYPDGELWQVTNFENNEMNGSFIAYYDINHLKSLGYKVSKYHTMINGEQVQKTSNISHRNYGRISKDSINELPIQEVGYFENGKAEGIFILYGTEGTYKESKYLNGVIVSPILEFYNNGKKRSIIPTQNGKKYGEQLIFDKSEILMSSIYFQENEIADTTKTYWKNGKIESINYYDNDHEKNVKKYYDSDGSEVEQRLNEFNLELNSRTK